MKFGRQLQEEAALGLERHYLSYKELKKAIKLITGSDTSQFTISEVTSNFGNVAALAGNAYRPPESRFQDLLNFEASKINNFSALIYAAVSSVLRVTLRALLRGGPALTLARWKEHRTCARSCAEAVVFLHSYVRLNFTGFRKITKKYDKHNRSNAAPFYIARLLKEPFVNFNFDYLVELVSLTFALLRRARAGVATGDDAAAPAAEAAAAAGDDDEDEDEEDEEDEDAEAPAQAPAGGEATVHGERGVSAVEGAGGATAAWAAVPAAAPAAASAAAQGVAAAKKSVRTSFFIGEEDIMRVEMALAQHLPLAGYAGGGAGGAVGGSSGAGAAFADASCAGADASGPGTLDALSASALAFVEAGVPAFHLSGSYLKEVIPSDLEDALRLVQKLVRPLPSEPIVTHESNGEVNFLTPAVYKSEAARYTRACAYFDSPDCATFKKAVSGPRQLGTCCMRLRWAVAAAPAASASPTAAWLEFAPVFEPAEDPPPPAAGALPPVLLQRKQVERLVAAAAGAPTTVADLVRAASGPAAALGEKELMTLEAALACVQGRVPVEGCGGPAGAGGERKLSEVKNGNSGGRGGVSEVTSSSDAVRANATAAAIGAARAAAAAGGGAENDRRGTGALGDSSAASAGVSAASGGVSAASGAGSNASSGASLGAAFGAIPGEAVPAPAAAIEAAVAATGCAGGGGGAGAGGGGAGVHPIFVHWSQRTVFADRRLNLSISVEENIKFVDAPGLLAEGGGLLFARPHLALVCADIHTPAVRVMTVVAPRNAPKPAYLAKLAGLTTTVTEVYRYAPLLHGTAMLRPQLLPRALLPHWVEFLMHEDQPAAPAAGSGANATPEHKSAARAAGILPAIDRAASSPLGARVSAPRPGRVTVDVTCGLGSRLLHETQAEGPPPPPAALAPPPPAPASALAPAFGMRASCISRGDGLASARTPLLSSAAYREAEAEAATPARPRSIAGRAGGPGRVRVPQPLRAAARAAAWVAAWASEVGRETAGWVVGGGAARGARAPAAAAVRVEPKTFFANERTFLQWMNTAVLLSTIAITLLNFGTATGRVAGLVMAPVALFFIGYAFLVFLRRSRALERKEPINYNDRLGPAVLVGCLIAALSAIILLNFLHTSAAPAAAAGGGHAAPAAAAAAALAAEPRGLRAAKGG